MKMHPFMVRTMIRISVLACCMAVFPLKVFSQTDTAIVRDPFLTLDRVHELARENYPMIARYDIIGKNKEMELLKADWGYLPSIVLSGKASYQTEVVTFPDVAMQFMEIDPLSRDQYQVALDFNQMIWDGGDARLKRKVAEADAEVKVGELERDLYSIRDKINDLYFGDILLDASVRQLELNRERLQINFDMLDSCYSRGTVAKTDLDLIRISMIELEQKMDELQAARVRIRKGISLFVGYDIGNVELKVPRKVQAPSILDLEDRPEMRLFESRQRLADFQLQQVDVRKIPSFSFFMQGAYGRPGYDMLNNGFRPYGVLGFRMQWTISNFFYSKRVKGIMNHNAVRSIAMEKDLFEFDARTRFDTHNAEIDRLEKVILKDVELIDLRRSVRESSEKKAERGIISVSDLLQDINLENQAELNRIVHEMELLKEIYSVKNVLNK